MQATVFTQKRKTLLRCNSFSGLHFENTALTLMPSLLMNRFLILVAFSNRRSKFGTALLQGTVSAHHAMIFLEQGSFYITETQLQRWAHWGIRNTLEPPSHCHVLLSHSVLQKFCSKDLGSCNGTCLRLSAERQESGWHPIMDGDVPWCKFSGMLMDTIGIIRYHTSSIRVSWRKVQEVKCQ